MALMMVLFHLGVPASNASEPMCTKARPWPKLKAAVINPIGYTCVWHVKVSAVRMGRVHIGLSLGERRCGRRWRSSRGSETCWIKRPSGTKLSISWLYLTVVGVNTTLKARHTTWSKRIEFGWVCRSQDHALPQAVRILVIRLRTRDGYRLGFFRYRC